MAVKLSDAFIQINASMDGFQRQVAGELAGLGKVGQKAGKDVGDSFTKKFGDEAKSLDSSVKKGLDGAGAAGKSAGADIGSQMSKSVNDALGSIDFGSLVKKAGVAGAAIAGAASLGELVSAGREVSGQIGALNRELGLTGDVAKGMGDEVSQLMRSGVVGSAEEAAAAVGAMKSQFQDMPVDQIDGLADNLSAFAKTFEMDVAESTQIAGQLITNGLATDVESAADMMTVSMQKVPQAMRGEIGDAISEYGTNFANLGYSGEEAFSMLVAAAEGGQYQIDKTGDAIKEFSVLAIDPAKAEVFESLGINATDAARAVAEGGEGARKTLEQTAQKLLEMEDPGARAAAAVELFGAPVEDLGVDKIPAFLEGLSGTAEGLGDVEGASQRLSDSMANSLQGRLDAAKGWMQSLAGDGFMAVWDATQWVINGVGKLAGPVTDSLGEVWGKVQEFGGGVRDILFEGDYTGLPFGLGEDSGVVDFLFDVRETVVDTKDTVTAAWDELTAAFTGGDWGYGALSTLIGEERAQELVDMLADIGDRFRSFKDRVSEAFSELKSAVQPVFEWMQEFFTDQMSGTLDSLWESFESIGSAVKTVADAFAGALWDALQGAWDMFKGLWDLLSPVLLPVLKVIGAVVGGVVVGAFVSLIGTIRVVAEVIEVIAKVIQWFAENVLSPLIGLVGDVARAFGEVLGKAFGDVRADWDAFTSALASGWEWVKGFFTDIKDLVGGVVDILFKGDYTGLPFGLEEDSGLVNFFFTIRETAIKAGEVIAAVWDGIVTAGKVAFAILGTVVLTPFILAWNYLSAKVKEGWETVIKPAWDAMSAGVTWLWENAIKPVIESIVEKWDILQLMIGKAVFAIRLKLYEFQAAVTALWAEYVQPVLDLIRGKWDELSAAMAATWNTIKTAVFDAWNAYVDQVKANWDTVTNALNAAWTALKDHFSSIWNTIKTSVLDAWNTAVNFLKDTFDTITTTISDKWTWLKDQMSNVWSWIRDNVFSKFNSAIDLMRSGAEIAMDGIGKAFDWLREKTAKPVNFLIETVYMGGIRKAWGAVASLVGLDELPKIEKIGGFASGGILPGYTPGRDPYTFIEPSTGMSIGLSGGEAIMRPEATRALGPDWVDGVNAAARLGGKSGVEKYLGGFASGGVVPSIVNIVKEKFPMMTITSTYRNTSDHHGAGKAVDFSNGTDSTPAMRGAAQWFSENYGRSLLELIHSPSPFNIKNGQGVGDGFGFYGAGTMNAHRNHVHVAANEPLAGGGTGGVLGFLEGAVSSVSDMAKSAWDGVINKIPGYSGETGGLFGDLPGAFLKKTAGAAWDFIAEKVKSIGAFFGNPGAGVDQWRGLVESTLAAKGFSTDLADTVLRRMNQESGGDPRAINNWDSNAAAGIPSKGLMQVIDPTFAAHKDPGFDDIWDPESNLRASMNYAMGRYGSLPAAYNRAGGYHDGGLAPAGQGLMHKTALEPEMVLSPKMTKAFIDWMRGTPGGESASVVAKEFAEAFHGGDWGMGELASYIGVGLAESTINVVAAIGKADRGFREWAESETVTEARRKFEGDSRDALIGGGRSLAVESLDLVGLGAVVDIAEGVGGKIHGILQDEEVREAVKKVQLDPDMSYSGREIEKKLRELGVDVERIKSQLSGSVLGGLVGMA